ncbi:MAG: Acetate kinase, partial [uncultured Acidimicrobiales bacterium]
DGPGLPGPRRQRRVEHPETAHPRSRRRGRGVGRHRPLERRRRPLDARADRRCDEHGGGDRTPGRSRGRRLLRAGGRRRRHPRRHRGAHPAGPPAPAAGGRRNPGRTFLGAGRAGGRLLRHRLPRHHAAGGGDLRVAGGVAAAVGAAPVRLPRPVPPVR